MNNELKHELTKELEDIAPKLAAMNKTNPFGLPENYFNSFEYRLMQQIKREETPKITPSGKLSVWWVEKVSILFSGRVMATVVASCIVLGVALSFLHTAVTNAGNHANDSGLEFSGLTNQELGNYVINHSDEFDLSDVDPETLNTVAQNYKMKDASQELKMENPKYSKEDSDQLQSPGEEVL